MGLYFGHIQQEVADSISIYPTYVNISSAGGSGYTTVTSSSDWSYIAGTVPAWVTVTSGSGGSSGQNFTFTVPAYGSPRSCNIRICLVSNNSVYQDFTVDQSD